MSLSTIFAAINTSLATQFSGITTRVGADQLRIEDGPPRVVWVPTSETFGPSETTGDSFLPGATKQPAPLFTRIVTVEAHIWAASPDAVEALITGVVQATYGITFGSFDLQGGQWQLANNEELHFGAGYVMNMIIKIPVTRLADTYSLPITSMPISREVDMPNGNIVTNA